MNVLRRVILVFSVIMSLPVANQAQTVNMDLLQNLKFRSIGPAGMSGRVTAIDVVLANPDIIYIGTASGGLWKSTSGGIAWSPMFDTMAVASVGAVAIDQRKPDVVWIGTGEGNPRNSQTNGNGVYKTLDGGKTWIHLGLENTRNIHRVILHPDNPDIAFVAALGAAWGESDSRGVYKTTNGGASWTKILYVDTKTGAADLVMDPSNPNKLIAAMWEYRRWPWFFKSGGPGSGLYITIDGGVTWKKRTKEDGLPDGDLGRIGLAIARSQPSVIYALIESKKNSLYRSDNGGTSWKMVSDKNIGNRPFYYHEIYVDPKNENRVYNLYSVVSVSEDGGKTFQTLIPWDKVHPDHHAWWIHPDDPNYIINGNDGGLAISRDRGKTWRFVENLPVAQFYHIDVDERLPYNVYGGMQDNGSWRGPSYVWASGGIRNSYWEEVAFGDGFDVVPDRSDNRYLYAMSQGGFLYRVDTERGEKKVIRPVHPSGIELRFNWNAGIAHDPFSPTTIYYGSQFLHRSTDRGTTWQMLSPDLTTNDTSKQKQRQSGGLTFDVTSAENHTSIIAIAPSPLKEGVIWVGTDDGNVQLTTDGGKSWKNVVRNIRGVPESTWVPQIKASTYSAGEAFVVFDNHRRNDWTPYLYRTRDFGSTWTRLADEKSVNGFALSVIQDPVEPRLMFLGTEFGLYMSVNEGQSWTKWKHSYPTVSTMDMVIHPREHDLIVGTFGRSAYVLDDIRPLRELARRGPAALNDTLRIFPIPDAYLVAYKQAPGTRFAAEAHYSGDNRPYGARISFTFTPDSIVTKTDKKKASQRDTSAATARTDTVKIEIANSTGSVIRTLQHVAKRGVNRMVWSLDRRGERPPTQEKPEPSSPEPGGPQVLPGEYTVRIASGKFKDSTKVRVLADPRIEIQLSDMTGRDALRTELLDRFRTATIAADRLREARKIIANIEAVIKDREGDEFKKVRDLGKTMQDSITMLIELIQEKEVQGITDNPELVSEALGLASWYLNSAWDAPGETERGIVARATQQLSTAVGKINSFFETRWPRYKEEVDSAKISFFLPYSPIEVPR